MNATCYTAKLRYVAALLAIACALAVHPSARAEDAEPAAADEEAGAAATEDAQPAPVQQARIDVLVVEWSGSDITDIGTSVIFRRASLNDFARSFETNFPRFGSPSSLGFSLFVDRIRFDHGEMQAVFQALQSNEHVKILSRQTLVVAEGEQGRIATTNRVPYEATHVFGSTTAQVTQFRDTGVTFVSKLQSVINGEYLVLLIAADVKELGRRVTVALADTAPESVLPIGADRASLKVPEFAGRRISTTVAVRDGDTLVLGGLVSKDKSTDERTVPVLGPGLEKLSKVPVLGMLAGVRYLFTSHRERDIYRELIFFVTPSIDRGRRVFLPEELAPEPETELEPDKNDAAQSSAAQPARDEE